MQWFLLPPFFYYFISSKTGLTNPRLASRIRDDVHHVILICKNILYLITFLKKIKINSSIKMISYLSIDFILFVGCYQKKNHTIHPMNYYTVLGGTIKIPNVSVSFENLKLLLLIDYDIQICSLFEFQELKKKKRFRIFIICH